MSDTILVIHITGVLTPLQGHAFAHLAALERVLRFRTNVFVAVLTGDEEPGALAQLMARMSPDLRPRILGDAANTAAGRLGDRPEVALLVRAAKERTIYVGGIGYLRESAKTIECDAAVGLDRNALIRLRGVLLPKRFESSRIRPSWSDALRTRFISGLIADDVQLQSGWAPCAVTIIPNTAALAATMRSGTLARRLFRGLERIYVSEFSLLSAPSLIPTARQLREQFPERLRVVPFDDWLLLEYRVLHQKAGMASEFFAVGQSLRECYLEDFERDRRLAQSVSFRLRVGPWPKCAWGWIRELLVMPSDWEQLYVPGMEALRNSAKAELAAAEAKAVQALMLSVRTDDKADDH